MRRFGLIMTVLAGSGLIAGGSEAAKPPTTWDGLVQVRAKRLDLVYLRPGADFRAYNKVMLDPVEIGFDKDWQRDYNISTRNLSSRLSDRDVKRAITEGTAEATDLFSDAWSKGGYQVVNAPGPDVLRVRVGIINIRVSAPDTMSPGRSYTFSRDAGSATLFVEAVDSTSGALLGRAVDHRIVGDNFVMRRTSISNRGDFRNVVRTWASIAVRGMTELKSLSPINQ